MDVMTMAVWALAISISFSAAVEFYKTRLQWKAWEWEKEKTNKGIK